MGTQDVRCGGTAVRRPPRAGLSRPCRACPKIWGFEMVSMRRYDHVPLFRFLVLVTAGTDEGR